MSQATKTSTLGRISKWFDPRARSINMVGFILNRITALGLTLYLFLHLVVLSQLSQGPGAYENFLSTIHNPFFTFMEVLVVTAGFMHGFNGIRIALNSFGVGSRYQKGMMVVLFTVAILLSLIFAVRMFTA
jgi:succinate dehydrogenase / fumarate reductase, cytochrome b subunit